MSYYSEFFRNLLRKGNTGVLAFILLNALIMISMFQSIQPGVGGVLIGICAYMLSLALGLSFIGEGILRYLTGCTKITDDADIRKLDSIVTDVYNKVKRIAPFVPEDVQFYIQETPEVNAFATGRKTICITRGMLEAPDEYIKAVLGHEFGHLVHHDTVITLIVTVGNLFMNLIFLFARTVTLLITALCVGVASDGRPGLKEVLIVKFMDWIMSLGIAMWTYFGLFLVNVSTRKNEFRADEFSWQCGYGDNLLLFLRELNRMEKAAGRKKKRGFENPLATALMSTHPPTEKRIQHLKELMKD